MPRRWSANIYVATFTMRLTCNQSSQLRPFPPGRCRTYIVTSSRIIVVPTLLLSSIRRVDESGVDKPSRLLAVHEQGLVCCLQPCRELCQ